MQKDPQLTIKKKLIEVALPLEAINIASAREKSIRHGHPSTLHLWWARRPLAAARAVIFAQMVDDPSGHPDLFPTEKAQEQERKRLFEIIENLVRWESTTDDKVLEAAREEIRRSWRQTCHENSGDAEKQAFFDPSVIPAFHDPFAGGGAIPLEAQRLGLEAHATDLNPVAVLINKAMIEIPPRFAGRPPINPDWQRRTTNEKAIRNWRRAEGLAEDVRYYGRWMRAEAEKRIGHLYPRIDITPTVVQARQDLKAYEGSKLPVIAWLWARTVRSPNPAFADVEVPLASTFMLSTKPGKETHIQPIVEGAKYRFSVVVGIPSDVTGAKNGTKLSRGANFKCLMSGVPISPEYIYSEAKAGRMGARLMAIVAEGTGGRVYLPPTKEMEDIAKDAHPEYKPDVPMPANPRWFSPPLYGLTTFGDLFTARQLLALTTFSDLVGEARAKAKGDAKVAGYPDEGEALDSDGSGSTAYSDAIGVYLACGISRSADFWSSLCIWANQPKNEIVTHLFGRQAIPMAWDFAEANPFSDSGGNFEKNLSYVTMGIDFLAGSAGGQASQMDAASNSVSVRKVVSTDPPYYDNIGYADLSDYFYVWLRRSLRPVFPELFSFVAVPKAEELVATPYRHGGKSNAEKFFLDGMTQAMHRLAEQVHPCFPVTIYYAFKQTESDGSDGTTNTGWDTFLAAVIAAGFSITGTWPMRTERRGRMIGNNTNALASSIVLVCRPRAADAPTATRREFLNELRVTLPVALAHLQRENIAPVDLAQASIGPGMAVYTRFANVLDASGKFVGVGQALALINEVLDEVLATQDGDFDADTRWALSWFEQFGFSEGDFGIAETLSKAKNTAVSGIVEARICMSKASKVRLFRPDELSEDWTPETNARLTVWETVHHLIRSLSQGEASAATLAARLGTRAEIARELAYRLYAICERKKRTTEALTYNALVQSWPEIMRLSRESMDAAPAPSQSDLFGTEEEN
jgi:putative DNA methylase